MAPPEVILVHPNRDKAEVKATRVVVILLLFVSAALMTIVLIGGWSALAGQKPALIAYILIYILLAYYAGRWNRGVLPVAASLAIILAIFAAVAGPGWFARDKAGFTSPAMPESMLGLLTYIIIPVQLLLIIFASRGFGQDWHVEVEQPADGSSPAYDVGGPEPQAV